MLGWNHVGMSGANHQQSPSLPIRDEFINLLETEWTRQVACQNECRPPESCSCQRTIVHVHALEAWWKKQASESPHTKLACFLDEMSVPDHLSLPIMSSRIYRSGQSCLRILSLLLEQGRDHLIDRFYEANMFDAHLPHSGHDQNLREQLAAVVHHQEVEHIMGDFHKQKWKFCPLPLTWDMHVNLHGTKVIPPFCSKIKLLDKGGTASIYWVAVQKDLVSDNTLARALQDSLYTDKEFGQCYQMVLKSYGSDRKRDFELEKEAFLGLQSSDEVPILRYLGSYTHDYGEGEDVGKTYNLLLEYGENDLYQAWADETNVPPVQAQEILQHWKSLFKVADAIRHVHHLEVVRSKGRPRRYHGWHADIKPDNILSVRGRLKLADFGFASFAPVVDGHEDSVPTELIRVRGFTDTYGAPEVSRMRHPDGTLSGVTQAIDTWSFGCVLSVAATWIVLGFQGLRQYDRLRRLSPANNKNGQRSDRFHDGDSVLPEIEKWHNYLRGHLRLSDTTTEKVLDIIESKLLRANPATRSSLEELCVELQELSDWAQHKIQKLPRRSKDTDSLVMRALSSIEEEAQIQRTSEPKNNPLQPPLAQVNPRERASMQVKMEEMIRNKPLGQTAHRMQILEEKLGDCHNQEVISEPLLMNAVHNGAVTESPIDSTLPKELQFGGRQIRPRNPQFKAYAQKLSDLEPQTPNGVHTSRQSEGPATPPSSSSRRNKVPGPGTGPHSDDSLTAKSHSDLFEADVPGSGNSRRLNLHIPQADSPSPKYCNNPMADKETYSTGSPPLTPINFVRERNINHNATSSMDNAVNRRSHKGDAPAVFNTIPTNPSFDDKLVEELRIGASGPIETFGNAGPSIIVSPTGGAQFSHYQPVTPSSSTHFPEKEALHNLTSSTPYETSALPLPGSALELPYDICLKRKAMEEQVSRGVAKGLAKLRGTLGFETRSRDTSLEDTFSDPREIMLVIDNGWTMCKHWPIVTFVAQTLAMSAAGLDRDGFDVKFTVDGRTHDQQRLRGDRGRKKLKKALKAAWPEQKPNNNTTTDMAQIFQTIFEEWKQTGKPATTLLVLTDGVWSNENTATFDKIILDIARLEQRPGGSRHFSIQFIRFDDGLPEKIRLQWLDDHLCAKNGLKDIIDHCSWRANVEKLLTGSIEVFADNHNSVDRPMLYDYEELAGLFNTFNKGGDSLLSPTGTPSRTPSRASKRSSISNSDDWTRKG